MLAMKIHITTGVLLDSGDQSERLKLYSHPFHERNRKARQCESLKKYHKLTM